MPAAKKKFDDSESDCSTTASPPTFTPTSTVLALRADERLWNGHVDVPWPGHTFQITTKDTRKTIAVVGSNLVLLDGEEDYRDPRTLWLCVEKNGYFAFQNPSSGIFFGHDGRSGMLASALELNKWEMWTPRQHPGGGYQLLSPFWSHTLMVLCVARDGRALTRRTHGTTLWEFVRID